MKLISFGEWLPDLPSFGNDGLTKAYNVIAGPEGYRPLPALSAYSTGTTTGTPLGAGAVHYNDAAHIFIGDTSKLYKLDGGTNTWTDKSNGTYLTGLNGRWNYAAFGSSFIASNGVDNPQVYDVDADSGFTDLTTAVKGYYVASIRDFVVFGNTWDSSNGTVPHRCRWSALNDATDYTASVTTQSGFQDLIGGGDIKGIHGGEFGIILQERSIWRMTYVGTPVIWQFDEVERGRGIWAPKSLAGIGPFAFFLDQDGFYLTDGSNPAQPIGNEKVDRWFFDNFNTNYFENVTATVDPVNRLVIWSYPSTSSVDGSPDSVLMYNYALGRWTYGEAAVEFLVTLVTAGYTLDGLDGQGTLDTLPNTLDSDLWNGGDTVITGVKSDGSLYQFTGANTDAVFETGDHFIGSPFRSMVRGVTPFVDGGTLTVQTAAKTRLNDSSTFDDAVSQTTDGPCPIRVNDKIFKFRLNATGTWDNAQGLYVDFKRIGRR